MEGKIVNKTKKDRLLAGSMSIMVAASSLMPAAAVHAEDTQLSKMITPVMISEIVADTHQSDQVTASGTDALNTSNFTIHPIVTSKWMTCSSAMSMAAP